MQVTIEPTTKKKVHESKDIFEKTTLLEDH